MPPAASLSVIETMKGGYRIFIDNALQCPMVIPSHSPCGAPKGKTETDIYSVKCAQSADLGKRKKKRKKKRPFIQPPPGAECV